MISFQAILIKVVTEAKRLAFSELKCAS